MRSISSTYPILLNVFILIVISFACHNKADYKKGDKNLDQVPQKTNSSDGDRQFLRFTSGVRSMLEDSRGNIWFGSHNEGLAKIEGNKISYFTEKDGLSSNQIRSIFEDEKGTVWFETGEGISRYEFGQLEIESGRNYSALNEWKTNENSLWFKGDKMTGFSESEGRAGVYEFDDNDLFYRVFPTIPNSEKGNYYSVTTQAMKSRNGSVWFGMYGAVIGFDGSYFTTIDNKYLGLNEQTGFLHVRSILVDSNDNLWIGNNGIGVIKFDGVEAVNFSAQMQVRKQDTQGHSLEKVFSMGEDDSGNIWFGTSGSGAWKYHGESLTNFTELDGLASDHIWTIYKSKQGEMWFGGADPSGVYRYKENTFERIF